MEGEGREPRHSHRAVLQRLGADRSGHYFTRIFAGHRFDQVRAKLRDELGRMRDDITQLMSAAVDAGSQATSQENVVVSGQPQAARRGRTFQQHGHLRACSNAFEQKTGSAATARQSRQCRWRADLHRRRIRAAAARTNCSLVTAPYSVDGQVVGTLGVVGPTRMAYERVVPMRRHHRQTFIERAVPH